MYHDMIDEIDDKLEEIERDTVKGVSLKDGWIYLDMKDGSQQQLIFCGESLFKDEFDHIAHMIFSRLKSKPVHLATETKR